MGPKHMLYWMRMAMLGAVCLCFAGEAMAEKRVALVIGNDSYTNLAPDQQLRKAVNDARTIERAFKSLGFEVVTGVNLGRQGIIDKLADFTARLQPGDIAAVFFAGHGVAIQNVNYLVPSDVPTIQASSEARLRGASVAEPDLLSEIQAKQVRVALVVIDACRENPFPTGPTRSLGRTRGLAEGQTLRGVFKIYSAGENQTALDRLSDNDPATNSVFTRVFVEQLMRPELHLADVAFETREKVAALALTATDGGRPAPHEQTPGYYDQTVGGRVFLGRRDGALPVARAPDTFKSAAATAPVIPVTPPAPPVIAVTPPPPPPEPPRQQQAAISPPPASITRSARPSAPGERCARNGLDLYCVSSVLSSQFGNTYGPANLFSGGQSVAWVEGRSGQGIGEWIVVEFDSLRTVDFIQVRTGYQKNADIFYKNSRVRQLRAEFSNGHTMTLRPQDDITVESFRVDPGVKAYWVKFMIEAVYPGNKYTDTAIGKLNVQSRPAQ